MIAKCIHCKEIKENVEEVWVEGIKGYICKECKSKLTIKWYNWKDGKRLDEK